MKPRKASLKIIAAGVGLGSLVCSCASHPSTKPAAPQTKMMVIDGKPSSVALGTFTFPQVLAQAYSRIDPQKFPYGSEERVAELENEQKQNMSLDDHFQAEFLYARELLNVGRSEEALRAFSLMEAQVTQYVPERLKTLHQVFLYQKAICSLRIGEQQNCCSSNNQNSCLIPIRGKGLHTQQKGSLDAIKYFTEYLKLVPSDIGARWLLNIAYMTIGQYPYAVPSQWVVPEKNLGSEYPMKPFVNVAHSLGLDTLNCAGGAALEDFDGDGNLDVMTSDVSRSGEMHFFHNNGDGTFTDRTKAAGLSGETGALNFITTDYNNDGNVDVLLLRGGWYANLGHLPVSLLRNNGDGTFTNVTMEAGLLRYHPSQAAVWFDYNGDGFLDLFIGDESTPGDPQPCELFRNNGDGTFTECAHECGVDKIAYVKAVVSADYDKDGRPDLYLSCMGHANMLLHNDGPVGGDKSPKATYRFADVAHAAGVDKQHRSFSCCFFDYDNDGWPDLYVGGYGMIDVGQVAAEYYHLPTDAEHARLYHNNHDGTFTDVSKDMRMYRVIQGMGFNFGDLDNDGFLDLYAGTGNPDWATLVPNRMFRNSGGRLFQEVTTTGNFGHLQKGHGIAFGDINNDGTQDILAEMGGVYIGDKAHNCLYANPGNKNHWIDLKLIGSKTNRQAVGADITVTIKVHGHSQSFYRTIGSGGNFGCSPFRSEIGLGDAESIGAVSIHWPVTGQTQVVQGVEMDHFYRIREGEDKAEVYTPKTFKLQ